MTLQTKILQLKLDAALAVRHAQGWQRLIDLYGEDHATAFYSSLGLNHLPRKSFDYDGLQLSREPKPHEALQVKAIAAAQESGKQRLSSILLAIRSELTGEALKQLKRLSAANYHELVVRVSDANHELLGDMVLQVFDDGRLLIQTQRGQKADDDIDFDDELDILTDVTASRIANDVQARIVGAASRFALLGLSGGELLNAVTNEANTASVSYVERAATGLANRTLNLGRSAEAARHDWDHVEYSALLDQNVCEACASFDGTTAINEDDLEPAPSPSCHGADLCRCFHVFVSV